MTTQRNDTKVIIDKWRLDALVDEAEFCLKRAGETVSTTVVAADYKGEEEHDNAVKDAARCYCAIRYLVEQIKGVFENGKEVVV